MAKETREISLDGVEHLPCHLLRRPNGIKTVTEDPATCDLCIAKASVLNRIKAAGGDIVVAAAKAKEEVKTKPAGPGILTAANLTKIKEKGGYVIKTEAKENDEGKPVLVATVRLPDACIEANLTLRPCPALLPLPEDYFEEDEDFFEEDYHPVDLREATLASACQYLASIEQQENIVAQIAEKGHITLDMELEDGLDIGGNSS